MMNYRSMDLSTDIKRAAELIRLSKYVVVLTGAGSSTPSGIPDFRSTGSGLWSRYSPMEVASLTTFRHHPEKFFEWLRPLAKHMLLAKPNASHNAFYELERGGYLHTIITQNIDGLHQRAGSQFVIEVHGTLNSLSCIGCYQQIQANGYIEPYIQDGEIPRCPKCNKIMKPDVVLFEEQLPIKPWLKAREAVKTCDLLIVSGSSLVVMPVAGLPVDALENHAKIIVINKTPTYIDEESEVVLYGDIAEIVPAISAEVIHA
jgi:NAD-dependent deacetylase